MNAPLLQPSQAPGPCPICHRPPRPWRVKHTPHGEFRIDHCRVCDYAFVNPRPTLAFLMDYYDTSGHSHTPCATPIESAADAIASEARYPNSTLDAERIVGMLHKLAPRKRDAAPRLLDVGCGYGFYSREAIRLGFDVNSIELASRERRIAEELAGIKPHAVPFEAFEAPAGSFAAILMSQILEHAHDVDAWLQTAYRLAQPGGVIAVAVPNYGSAFRRLMGTREPFITPPEHLNFFTPRSLSALLRARGFSVIATHWVSRIPPNAFSRRLPAPARPLAPVLNVAARFALRSLDALQLGQLITVFARKPL